MKDIKQVMAPCLSFRICNVLDTGVSPVKQTQCDYPSQPQVYCFGISELELLFPWGTGTPFSEDLDPRNHYGGRTLRHEATGAPNIP